MRRDASYCARVLAILPKGFTASGRTGQHSNVRGLLIPKSARARTSSADVHRTAARKTLALLATRHRGGGALGAALGALTGGLAWVSPAQWTAPRAGAASAGMAPVRDGAIAPRRAAS
jgi:hypothetical protein